MVVCPSFQPAEALEGLVCVTKLSCIVVQTAESCD